MYQIHHDLTDLSAVRVLIMFTMHLQLAQIYICANQIQSSYLRCTTMLTAKEKVS